MKCSLCGKEFPKDISDFDLVQHFINEHNKEVKEIGKDILKAKSKTENKVKKIKVKILK